MGKNLIYERRCFFMGILFSINRFDRHCEYLFVTSICCDTRVFGLYGNNMTVML